MTDIQQNTSTSAAGSPYSFTSTKYWCANCRRQFSQLKVDSSMSQTHCPRCDSLAQELPPNANVSGSSSSTNQQQQQRRQAQFFTQTFMDPFGRVFVQTTRVPTAATNNNNNMETENSHHHHHHRGGANNLFSQLFGGAFDPFFGFGTFPGFGFGSNINIDESVIEEFLRNDPNQYGPPPAPQEAINKLQEVKFDAHEGAEVTCCPICQEDYKHGESLVRLPCKHDYHGECVKEWLTKHNSCPMCRQAI